MTDNIDDRLYKYTSSGVFIDSFALDDDDTVSRGVAVQNGMILVLDDAQPPNPNWEIKIRHVGSQEEGDYSSTAGSEMASSTGSGHPASIQHLAKSPGTYDIRFANTESGSALTSGWACCCTAS